MWFELPISSSCILRIKILICFLDWSMGYAETRGRGVLHYNAERTKQFLAFLSDKPDKSEEPNDM